MRPFEGLRVLDVTRVLAGPFATYQMALLGADVIKIEPPGRGESTRWRTEADAALGRAGMSLSFLTQASNKRSLTLNLDHPEGQAVFMRLAQEADVIVENLRTGSMAKRNIGYEQVRKSNPRIIWCAVTGYGQNGPKQRHPAYDSVIQAISGLMSVTGMPDSPPLKAGPSIVDYAAGLSAAFAVSAALFQRSRTGEGQFIDVPMLDSMLMLMASTMTSYLNTGKLPAQNGNSAPSRSPASNTFETQDGLLAMAINEDHQFRHLMQALGLADMLKDPKYADATARRENREGLSNALKEALMTKPAAEWESILNEAGVPAARVRNVAEIAAEPQVQARGLFHRFPADATGLNRELQVPLTPFTFASEGARADTPPPKPGQHTDEVLRQAGYANADIERLRAAGTI